MFDQDQTSFNKWRALLKFGFLLVLMVLAGCGGGGGGGEENVRNQPTLQISNGTSLSISRIGTISRVLSRIEISDHPTLSIFSLDGQRLEGPTVISEFPYTIELSGEKKTVAEIQGVLVACLTGGGNDYRTIFKISASDLTSNGPLQDDGGGIRTEEADGTSTVLAAITESELSNITNVPVRTCQQLSGSNQAAISNSVHKLGTSAVPVDELVDLSKDAARTTGSLFQEVLSTVAAATTSSRDIDVLIGVGLNSDGSTFTGAEKITRLKSLNSSAINLLRAGKNASIDANTFASKILSVEGTNALRAEAAANLIGAVMDLGTKTGNSELSMGADLAARNALNGSFTDAFEQMDSILEEAAVTIEHNDPEESDALSIAIGSALAGALPGSSAQKKAQGALKLALGLSADQERALGKALQAGFGNGSAVSMIVQEGSANQIDLSNALQQVQGDTKKFVAAAIHENTDERIQDSVRIMAPEAYQLSSLFQDLFIRLETVETAEVSPSELLPYTYEWNVTGASIYNPSFLSRGLNLRITNAGIIHLRVNQKLRGVVVASDTHQITVSEFPPPQIQVYPQSLTIRQGNTAQIFVNTFSSRDRLSLEGPVPEMVIGTGAGCATRVSGLRIAKNNEDSLIFGHSYSVTALVGVPISQAYCIQFHAQEGSVTGSKMIPVAVRGDQPTKVVVSPVEDQKEGDPISLSATAVYASGTQGNLSLQVSGPAEGFQTVPLSGRAATVTTTLLNLGIGTYTVTANVGSVSDSVFFHVNPASAPTNLVVEIDGVRVGTGDSVLRTTGSSSVWVEIDLSAEGAQSFAVHANQSTDSNDTGQNLRLNLPIGNNILTASASNSSGVSAQAVFEVIVNQGRDIEVTHVVLNGTLLGNSIIDASSNPANHQTLLSTAVSNDIYLVDAGALTGLDLNTISGDSLWFEIYTETPNHKDVDLPFLFEVSLSDDDSTRFATLQIQGAVLEEVNGGWDLTGADSFFFTGRKNNGNTAQVEVLEIDSLDRLFRPVDRGIKMDLLGLRDALKGILIDSGNTAFASRLDTLSGSGIIIEVRLSSPNFSFKSGTQNFHTFQVFNISVN